MRIGAFEIQPPEQELNSPHAIVVLRPWVNVGRVGTLVLSRLERHFGAEALGQLARPGQFFDYTRYRPRSRIVEGQREMRIPNSTISYARREEHPDFLFLNLREPHAFGEDYVDSILEILTTFHVRRYCMIGGMYDVVPHTRPLLVSGIGGGPDAEEDSRRLRLKASTYQGPTSILSLIGQKAPNLGMDHLTFVVHLPQYIELEEDYAGAARLMDMLCRIYGLPQHLADEERGHRQYQELTTAVDRNNELKSVLNQLESQYDANEASEAEEMLPLSPEVERFLRGLDDRDDEG